MATNRGNLQDEIKILAQADLSDPAQAGAIRDYVKDHGISTPELSRIFQAAGRDMTGFKGVGTPTNSIGTQSNTSGRSSDGFSTGGAARPGSGLSASNAAVNRGAQSALRELAEGRNLVNQTLDPARGAFQPFIPSGQQAFALNAAYSGALGPEAQRQAINEFQMSPIAQAALERGESAITRNSAALGGLGGGNVRKALQEFGQNVFTQDLQRQQQNLANISQQGMTAAQANLQGAGNQASLLSGLSQGAAGVQSGQGSQLANLSQRAAELIASNQANTQTNLANLINQQGQQAANLAGVTSSNLSSILQGLGSGLSANQIQQAIASANLASQAGTTGFGAVGSVPGVSYNPNAQTNTGNLLSGFGNALSAFSSPGAGTSSGNFGSFSPANSMSAGFMGAF